VVLDLRRFAGGLAAGEHVAVAHAGGLASNEYRFRIEAPEPPGAEPPPRDPRAPKPKPKPDPPPGAKAPGSDPKLERKFVEPLVRDGQKVKKKTRVPIEVPGGAPQTRTLAEAWPELLRRREAALKRPGLAPHVRKLVREYFERLRPAK